MTRFAEGTITVYCPSLPRATNVRKAPMRWESRRASSSVKCPVRLHPPESTLRVNRQRLVALPKRA